MGIVQEIKHGIFLIFNNYCSSDFIQAIIKGRNPSMFLYQKKVCINGKYGMFA